MLDTCVHYLSSDVCLCRNIQVMLKKKTVCLFKSSIVCHNINRVGSCGLCFMLQKCDVISGKGAYSERRCFLVFAVHCGIFREQTFQCTGRILRLRQPLKWPNPWSVPWLLNKGDDWDAPRDMCEWGTTKYWLMCNRHRKCSSATIFKLQALQAGGDAVPPNNFVWSHAAQVCITNQVSPFRPCL